MDFFKDKIGESTGSQNQSQNQGSQNQSNQSGGGGFMSKVNDMAGGGQKGEKNEDMLDKGKNPPPLPGSIPGVHSHSPVSVTHLLADS